MTSNADDIDVGLSNLSDADFSLIQELCRTLQSKLASFHLCGGALPRDSSRKGELAMSSMGAIAIEARPGIGQSARRSPGAQDSCGARPRIQSVGYRDRPRTGTGGHDIPGGETLGGGNGTHLDRPVVLGEIATLLAQEVKNPLGAMLLNAKAALNWLSVEEPNLDEARQAIADIVESGRAARELIAMIGDLAQARAG